MKRILIVEDYEPIRQGLRIILEEEGGYSVREAVNGLHALQMVVDQPPDLILCDVTMPMMGGKELAAHLRLHPVHAAIPVLLLTAAPVDCTEAVLYAAVMQKPYELDDLLERIRRCLADADAQPL